MFPSNRSHAKGGWDGFVWCLQHCSRALYVSYWRRFHNESNETWWSLQSGAAGQLPGQIHCNYLDVQHTGARHHNEKEGLVVVGIVLDANCQP